MCVVQTILATYFCSVDLVLFIQYFYYSSKALSTGSYPDDTASRYAQSRRIAADPAHAHVHYREISNAAADLAVVAAIAAEDEVVNSPIIGRHGHVVRSRTTSTVGPHKMHAPVLSDGTTVVSPTSITKAPEDEWQAEEEDERLVREVFSKVSMPLAGPSSSGSHTLQEEKLVTVKRKADGNEPDLRSLLSEDTRSLIASKAAAIPVVKKRKVDGKNSLGIKMKHKGATKVS